MINKDTVKDIVNSIDCCTCYSKAIKTIEIEDQLFGLCSKHLWEICNSYPINVYTSDYNYEYELHQYFRDLMN